MEDIKRRFSSRKFWFAVLIVTGAGTLSKLGVDIGPFTTLAIGVYAIYCGANVADDKLPGK